MATLTGEALRRVQRNYTQHGAVPAATSTLVWALYLSHWAATILAVRRTADTLPPPARPTRLVAGGLAGAGVAVAGVGTFASLAHMSGTSNEGLVTAGIYRHSRNPQNHGFDLMPRDVRLHRAGATAPGSARRGLSGGWTRSRPVPTATW